MMFFVGVSETVAVKVLRDSNDAARIAFSKEVNYFFGFLREWL
jgi:hypothetical protein